MATLTPEAKNYLDTGGTLVNGQIPTQRTTTTQTGIPLNSTTLSQGASSNFQSPNPTPIYPVSTLPSETPPLQSTPAETAAQDLTTRLQVLNKSLTGQADVRATQEAALGINDKTQVVNDLSARLTGLKNESLAIPLQFQNNYGGTGATTGGVAPLQTAALRNNAIESLSVSSQLQAAQGNLTTALALVDRAVANKFDPIKEEIAATQANLDLILKSPEYSREDKNRAQAQKEAQDKKAREIAVQEQNAKDVGKIGVDAAANSQNFTPTADYPTLSQALEAIRKAQDPITAQQIATQTGLGTQKNTYKTGTDAQGNMVEYTLDQNGKVIGQRVLSSKSQTPATSKGKLSDKKFVEQSLNTAGLDYNTILSQIPADKIGVIDNATGQVGFIDAGEYDSSLYTKL